MEGSIKVLQIYPGVTIFDRLSGHLHGLIMKSAENLLVDKSRDIHRGQQ